MLWYHDHGHGTTRLNVFAGLAGAYVIRDQYDTGTEDNANHLPVGYGTGPGNYEVPLVVQDRQFSSAAIAGGPGVGDWLYPRTPQVAGGAGSFGMCGNAPNQYGANTPGPWLGEYFGDEFLVNGLVAPFVNVEPRVYRLRVLNGCNARFLDLAFASVVLANGRTAPPPMVQIGAEQGLFASPVPVTGILLGPAERADIIVDFRGYAGAKMLFKNTPLPNPYASPAATARRRHAVQRRHDGQRQHQQPDAAGDAAGRREPQPDADHRAAHRSPSTSGTRACCTGT